MMKGMDKMLRKIIVSGSGEARAKPDTVEIGISISFIQPEARQAQELVADVTGKVLAELKAIGLTDKDIETRGFSINPRYEWKKDSRVFKGYEASNSLRITTDEFSLVNQIIEVAVRAGVKEVDYVSFTYRDRESLECEALAQAARNAMQRARAIAEGLGVEPGRVIRVSTPNKYRSYGGEVYLAREASPVAAPAPTSVVAPHEVKVTAEVEVILELAEGAAE